MLKAAIRDEKQRIILKIIAHLNLCKETIKRKS